jgi:PAS domain S-box-containing protein
MTDLPLALYESVMEHAPYGMALVGGDGAVLTANARLSTLLGVELPAPHAFRDLLVEKSERAWETIPTDQTTEWDMVLNGVHGAAHDIRVSVGPLIEGRARIITVADLTRHRDRERRLYALWEFSSVVSASLDLSVLLESISSDVCDVLEAQRVEFVLMHADTPGMEARAVYQAGAERAEITFFSDGEEAPAPMRQVLEQAETVFMHFQEDGSESAEMCSITLPMIARGVVIGAFTAEGCLLERHLTGEHISLCHAIANQTAIAVDNVRLLNAEISARREITLLQEYYRGILDNSPDGVVVTDADGVVRFWNSRMEEMFNVPGAMMLERGLFETSEYWQAHSAAFQRVVEREEPVRINRLQRENHRGEAVTESIHFQPLRRGAIFDGVMARVVDVTDEARMERQLIKSERMAAVGELAAGVAHNFNNVLAGIGGDAQLLRMIAEEENLGESVAASADMIYRETMRGGRIAHDLLSFAKGQEPCLSEVDVHTVVSEAVRLAKTYPQASNVDLRSQVPTGLPKVSGDPNQMHQVFFNVILNAVQAMPHGGSLLIDARIVSGDDGKARMEVLFEDTGVGIPQEQLNRIFDPFFSNRRGSTVGTGLGLSVSMSMVRGMDGDIRVDSEVGRGTTMTVTLPIIERRRRPRHGEKPKTRILVVDDEPNIRRTLSTFLGRRGYHVVAARDGREAMEILEDPEAVFGLAVVDLLMPRMSGLETIHAMRAARPHMPAVILTGVANTEELAQVEELGIARHLRKPVDFDLLTRTVEELAGPADAPVPVEV